MSAGAALNGRRLNCLLAVACLAALTTPAWAADDGAKAFIEGVLQRLGSGRTIAADQLYSPALAGLFQKADAAAARKKEVGCMDGDPVLDCQDCSPLTHVAVTIAGEAPGKAAADARFNVAGDDRTMRYDLVMTPRGWRIDDVHSSDTPSLRAYLAGPDCR
jgi:hypothetical protein